MKKKTIVPLLALLAADAISMSGNAMAAIAIPWFVLESTGSPTSTALSGAAGALPIVIAAIVGGVWVDRVGHQRASVYSDLASGVTIALIPILYALGWLTFPVLLLLVFCGALLDAPGAAARGALVPDVAQAAGWRLESVNSAHEVIESGSGLVGPLFGGLLIAAISAQNVLLVDAVSFMLSAALVALLIPGFFRRRAHRSEATIEMPAPEEEEEAQYEKIGVWAAFRAGVGYVWQDGPLRAIFGSAIFMNFILAPVFGLLLPVFLRDVAQSPEGLGAVVAAFGGGAVLGAIVYGARGHRWNRRALFLVGNSAFSAGIIALSWLPSVPVAVAIMFLMGLIVGPNGPMISTITHERTPAPMRGRVLGILNAMCFAGGPAGFLAAGWLLQSAGLAASFLLAGLLFGVIVALLVLDRGLRDLERAPQSEPAMTAM